ncbi:MAG: DNA repair protein RecN, partial [Lachnospiraceae bacterium]|nr:DNA repair protein RecN [Lachnospiraceae bacterium]
QTEARLDELNHLKAKYGRTLGDVMAALEERRERGEQLLHYDAYRQELLEKKAKLMEHLREVSSQVSDIRKSYGSSLAEQVRAQLADLNFLDVQFEAVFTSLDHFTEQGTDDVEFQISTNPGESLKPLHKVASGGELSRIMLALKTVLARQDDIGSLIFDEIDAGISGRTAQMVSEKMHVIASTHQVICISHLPQIAAMADTHFLIEKSVENDTTISTIRSLTEEERVEELARMLGGVKITDTVLESAREMRQLAEKSLK